MKNSYKLLFLFALLLGATTVQSQEYLEMIDAETFNHNSGIQRREPAPREPRKSSRVP